VHIKNQIYYHIHRNNQFSNMWYKGNKINLTTKQINNFNSYYDNYFPKIPIDNVEYPIIEAMSIINSRKLYANEKNAEIIVNQLHSIANELAIYMRESIFEEIRAEYFSDLPSRKSCIWLCEKESVKYWLKALNAGSNFRIFKLELTGVIHKADQRHLKAEVLPCELIRENAFNYWTGTDGNNHEEQEILFEGIINILDEFDKIDGIL
jgi:hypothetical protein